jgi:hypothetical protein
MVGDRTHSLVEPADINSVVPCRYLTVRMMEVMAKENSWVDRSRKRFRRSNALRQLSARFDRTA